MKDKTLVLGIESTAHTFSASVASSNGIVSDVRDVYSAPAGSGIHPIEAARHHSSAARAVVEGAMKRAKMKIDELDAVAYSMGPGLGPCLRVGGVVARTLSISHDKPLIPVNHAVGHIELGCLLTRARDPLVLLISGGHTMVVAFSDLMWRVLGETLDLTLGQLLDQVGRYVGFASPCGKRIEDAAGRSTKYLGLPYTVKGNDVSFSGLLTSAKRLIDSGARFEDVCFTVQETAFAITTEVTERALAFTGKEELMVVGGVAANRRLTEMLGTMVKRHSAKLHVVPLRYSGDCGAQIAWTGLLAFKSGTTVPVERSFVRQSWRLDTVSAPWRKGATSGVVAS